MSPERPETSLLVPEGVQSRRNLRRINRDDGGIKEEVNVSLTDDNELLNVSRGNTQHL